MGSRRQPALRRCLQMSSLFAGFGRPEDPWGRVKVNPPNVAKAVLALRGINIFVSYLFYSIYLIPGTPLNSKSLGEVVSGDQHP